MQVINHTDYETKELKAIFVRACKEEGIDTDRRVEVITSKKRYLHGKASLHVNWIDIYLPKDRSKFSRKELAQAFVHELGHNQGLTHDEMDNCWKFNVNWVWEYPLNKKQPVVKPKRNLKQERYDHAKKMLAVKEKTQKRLVNQIKIVLVWNYLLRIKS